MATSNDKYFLRTVLNTCFSKKAVKIFFSFYISYHDVMLKRNGMLLNFFSKHFDEKYMNKEK